MPKSMTETPASNIGRRRAAARVDGTEGYGQRRQEILTAAAAVFKERGYRGTTLAHVAEAMGVDRATLYYYVGSKDELFQDTVTDAVKSNTDAAKALQIEDISPPEKLRRIVEGLMEIYAKHYPFLYVLVQENLRHVAPKHTDFGAELRSVSREYERVVIEIIEEGQQDGTITSTAPAWLLANGIIGMVGWTNRWFVPGKTPATPQEIGSTFADLILNGLAAPSAADAAGNGKAPAKKPARTPRAPRPKT